MPGCVEMDIKVKQFGDVKMIYVLVRCESQWEEIKKNVEKEKRQS